MSKSCCQQDLPQQTHSSKSNHPGLMKMCGWTSQGRCSRDASTRASWLEKDVVSHHVAVNVQVQKKCCLHKGFQTWFFTFTSCPGLRSLSGLLPKHLLTWPAHGCQGVSPTGIDLTNATARTVSCWHPTIAGVVFAVGPPPRPPPDAFRYRWGGAWETDWDTERLSKLIYCLWN